MHKKVCSKCKTPQPLELFYNRKLAKDGKGCWCKNCMDLQRKKNPSAKTNDASRQKAREWTRKNPKRVRTKMLKKYGLTTEQYEDIFILQYGLCAICGRPEKIKDYRTGVARLLSVDHCHDTGKIRGLLCGGCNTGLGNFKDDANSLARAITYLGRAVQL